MSKHEAGSSSIANLCDQEFTALIPSELDLPSGNVIPVRMIESKNTVTLLDFAGGAETKRAGENIIGVVIELKPAKLTPNQKTMKEKLLAKYMANRKPFGPNAEKKYIREFDFKPYERYDMAVTHVINVEGTPDFCRNLNNPREYIGNIEGVALMKEELPVAVPLATFINEHEKKIPRHLAKKLDMIQITPGHLLETTVAR